MSETKIGKPALSAVLPVLLTGAERAAAIEKIKDAFLHLDDADATERSLIETCRADHSLLLERVLVKPESKARTLLEVGLRRDMYDLVEMGLQAGIHPDDPEAFGGAGMLPNRPSLHTNLAKPRWVDMALRHGADPDQPGHMHLAVADGRSLIRAYADELYDFSVQRHAIIDNHLASIRLLLGAGAKKLEHGASHRTGTDRWPFISLLASSQLMRDWDGTPVAMGTRERAVDLMRLLVDKGLAGTLDVELGGSFLPWWLCGQRRGESAAALIDLGYPIAKNRQALEASNDGAELVEKALIVCSARGAAAVKEAVMRRMIATAVRPADDAGSTPGPRQRGTRL